MENSMSRILIETTVRQTLKGLQDNPKRSVRNLVDMALHFSEGRFQYRFFQTAHTMLEHQDSAYYALVEDAVKHIETGTSRAVRHEPGLQQLHMGCPENPHKRKKTGMQHFLDGAPSADFSPPFGALCAIRPRHRGWGEPGNLLLDAADPRPVPGT